MSIINTKLKDINNAQIPANNNEDTLSDIKYICKSSYLITESLQKGFDVAQLPNGDIIITEVKTVNSQYSWDPEKNKMVRVNCNIQSSRL